MRLLRQLVGARHSDPAHANEAVVRDGGAAMFKLEGHCFIY